MKIAFYLLNKNLKEVDCHNLEEGNPGIGGTEYIIQSTVHYIRKLRPVGIDIVVGVEDDTNISVSIHPIVKVCSITDLIEQTNPDYVIFKYVNEIYQEAHKAVATRKTYLLPWAHNFISRRNLTVLANDDKVARIICVSREQLNMYLDHKAFLKSVYINNGMPVTFLESEKVTIPPLSERPHEVTYIGSIVDYKGFHLLAQAWPEVLKQIPDARLNVIGSGKLYDRTAQLGDYGIAEKDYEKQFMSYLTDDEGKIIPSVKFWGVLGIEKNDVLKRTRVGVPNPSGISETFCITALEMQAMGALVATIDFGGFINTVYRTGVLYKHTDELAASIVTQMKKNENDLEGFFHFMKENFAFEKVAEDWVNFFDDLENNRFEPLSYIDRNDNLSRLREKNRSVKAALPCGYLLPTIDLYRSILRRLKLC